MKTISNTRIAGLLLMLGMAIILVTIYFEYQIGWVTAKPRPVEEVPGFMKQHWDGLKSIWTWQALGYFLASVAYFHFTAIKRSFWRIRIGLLWSMVFILSLLPVVAFGITLGSYGEALAVYDSFPSLYDSIRGAVLRLYRTPGSFTALLTLIIFLFETFSKSGVVKRSIGIVVLVVVILGVFALPPLLKLDPKLSGIAFFLLPLCLGYAYFGTENAE